MLKKPSYAMPIFPCEPHAEPDFKLIVDRTVAVFAVYTGATLSFYVKDFLFTKDNLQNFNSVWNWASYWGSWGVIAVVALLLRYIVGSAIHLNRTYVPKETQKVQGNLVALPETPLLYQADLTISAEKNYQSKSLCWLLFDMLFLIVFGILAFFITSSTGSVEQLMIRSIYFMTGGLVWSVVAWVWRAHDRKIASQWLWIDLGQIWATVFLISLSVAPICKAVPLAILYVACLFADLHVMSKPR